MIAIGGVSEKPGAGCAALPAPRRLLIARFCHVQFRHPGRHQKHHLCASAKDWYVCIRPAAGKSYGNLDSGSENCAKP